MQAVASIRTITNDMYLAAYLVSQGLLPSRLLHNGRRRVSFEFEGGEARGLKEAYIEGPVVLDVRSFRDALQYIRRQLTHEQRSTPCPPPPPKEMILH